MRVNNVVGITSRNMGRNVAFTRAPKKGNEEQAYKRDIQHALDYIGVQNMALVLHGTSFPSKAGEYDLKTGTPNNAQELVEFARLHGFNAIQLGPNGKLDQGKTSPYKSSIFEKNPLFIDFNRLTTPEYASLLSEDDIKKVAQKTQSNGKNYDRTDFDEAQEINDALAELAFHRFVGKLFSSEDDKNAIALTEEFNAFTEANEAWLDDYAVANMIAKQYGTDDYHTWNDNDRELFQKVKEDNQEAISYYNDLEEKYSYQISQYKFTQFLADKQMKADNNSRGYFTYISDLEVGVSSLDELIFKDVFLSDYEIGCQKGGVLDGPQLWKISMPDPTKIFNADGSLGASGQFIKAKLQNALSGAQSIRIDHVMGLVNPYLYQPSSIVYKESPDSKGNMVKHVDTEKLNAGYLSDLKLEGYENYHRVLADIVIPTMKEMHVDPQKVIWEDLGKDPTGTFTKIFRQELGLPGISGMIWRRGTEEQNKPNNWAYVGCHDNKPGRMLLEDGDIDGNKHWVEGWTPGYLSWALRPDPYKYDDMKALEYKIASGGPKERWKAKLGDLFRSTKNVQISFMDFFGINKVYNTPGTEGGDNWTLRLNSDYKDTYYKALEDNNWAINMPEILKMAVQSKFDQVVSREEEPYYEEKAKVDPLLDRLEHWSQVLKEKE